jgi:hypothetical protein
LLRRSGEAAIVREWDRGGRDGVEAVTPTDTEALIVAEGPIIDSSTKSSSEDVASSLCGQRRTSREIPVVVLERAG